MSRFIGNLLEFGVRKTEKIYVVAENNDNWIELEINFTRFTLNFSESNLFDSQAFSYVCVFGEKIGKEKSIAL